MVRKVLLVGGVLSSLLYVISIDVIAALRYPDYHNYADQMVSELFAVGAPTRTLMVWLSIPYNVLVFVLAMGVWASAGGKRATRFTAAALVGYGAISTAGLLLFPMDVRGTVESQRDILAHCRHDSDVDVHRGDDGVRGFRTWDAVPDLLTCDHRNCHCVWRLGRNLGSSYAGANAVVGSRRASQYLRDDAVGGGLGSLLSARPRPRRHQADCDHFRRPAGAREADIRKTVVGIAGSRPTKKDARTMRMLIGYASRFGSTRDIAIRIADTVRTRGNDVDLRSVDEISDFDRYDAVVFGSGVYDGSWTVEATELMRRHAAVLARKPVWLFSVGSFGDRHPIVGGLIKKEPKEISEFEQLLHPRDYRVFAGVIDLDHWPAWGRLLFKALGGHAGDNRQWPDIDAWAEEIAHQLRPQE